jgi:hypothetical protein
MLAQAMRLPIARAQRQRHTQVQGVMRRADPSRTKSLDMVMGIGLVVQSMLHLVRTSNRSLKIVVVQELPIGNGGDGGDASSGNAVAVSHG